MKIFLTGGTGFIGSHFLSKGTNDGHQITALKRRNNSSPKIPLLSDPIWLVKEMDEVSVEELKGFEVLVHLAAHSVIYPFDSLDNCINYNVNSPLRLFNKAKLAGIKRFIVTGSCFEYGISGERYDFIPVNAPLEPTDSYSTSKAMASLAFQQFARDCNVQISIHRLFHVFGEGENDNRLWPSLRRAAVMGEDFPMTKGEQIRDFIEVSQVVKHLLEFCVKGTNEESPLIINVGSGTQQSILEFSQFWWDYWKAKGKLLVGALPYRKNEVMRFVPEI